MKIIGSFPAGFRIRSKMDLKMAMERYFQRGEEFYVIINKDHAVIFEITKTGVLHVYNKYGDLYDNFNPMISVRPGDEYNTLWKYRKYINHKYLKEV